jgi:ABC-type uncharacterized transport system permease subunit
MNPKALTRAAAVTIAWVAVVTIYSELSSAFKELLASIGGHHWIGKSVLSLVFFGILYLLFAKFGDDEFSLRDTWWLIGTVVVSGLAIVIFYVLHFLA